MNNKAANISGWLRQRGAVMVITLLAILLLAGLVMYVVNLGYQVNRSILTQHAADASAISGAGWTARSYNTVAMNNVAIARLLAAVNVLDSMPQAIAFTLEDQTALEEALQTQLNLGINQDWVRQPVEEAHRMVQQDIVTLTPLNELFNNSGFDVRETTWFETPSGNRGRAWAAMATLDDLSVVTMENLGTLSQLAAVDAGRENLGSAGEAFMVPLVPVTPWERGTFEDFRRPVTQGLLPEATDDREFRRGPYDTIFGWRDLVGGETQGYNSGGSDVASGGQGNTPVSSGPGNTGTWVTTGREPDAYRVYGPFSWFMRRIGGYQYSEMPYSRIDSWVRQISRIKLEYLWPTDDTPEGTRQVTDPSWIMGYPASVNYAQDNEDDINSTLFAVVEVKSRYPRTHPSFMSEGSWAYDTRGGRRLTPRLARTGGWQNPADWGVPMIQQYIWEDRWEYAVFQDPAIGIDLEVDTVTGEPIAQPVYRVDSFIFLGIDVGEPVDVTNPHNVTSPSELPAPIDFDHSQITDSDEDHRDMLRVLAIARRSNAAPLWPNRFERGKFEGQMLKMSQASIFNNHSWDLWTQMWQAQLDRIGPGYDDWQTRMEDQAPNLGAVPFVDADAYEGVMEYMHETEDLAELLMNH